MTTLHCGHSAIWEEYFDNTTEEAGEASNVEQTESVKVFFPDGTMSTVQGGQENLERYKELVQKAKSNGYDIELNLDLMKEATRDYQENNLVNACLLQYPFGRGGLHENRKRPDGTMSRNVSIEEYVKHLSMLSQPQFHHDLFSLILYNMSMKQEMVKTAGWKVRDRGNAGAFAQELSAEEVTQAIHRKRSGHDISTSTVGSRFVGVIDAVSRSVPHTNEAAKRARQDGEAHQHYFGLPHFFLTTTPDDDNSFLVQVYAQTFIDDDTPVSQLTDEELRSRSSLRTELRIKHPGLCAFYYQLVLDIVIEEVIGWDVKKQSARPEGGLFGKPLAFTASTEEQGRTTLHTHFQLWIEGMRLLYRMLYCSNRDERRQAEIALTDRLDKVASCKLFDGNRCHKTEQRITCFDHECRVDSKKRKQPVIVDDQQLRNLRHRKGCEHTKHRFADCPHCGYYWTNEELIGAYLLKGRKVPGLTSYPDQHTKRLKAMAVEYQKSPASSPELPGYIIDAAYNHHIHAPTSCFGSNKQSKSKKTKREMFENQECRYRYPLRKKTKTLIQDTTQSEVKWYMFNGTFSNIHVKEVCIKRHAYDAFQNVSCPAISHSKLTCNTNVSLLMPGPVTLYSFKYCLKSTQEDDTEQYERVKEITEKVLSKLQKDATDCSIAVSRILAASFAHQKTNVLGGALASYLTRKKSRFTFSHKTVWCPMRDIKRLLRGESICAQVDNHGKKPFFVCHALHYLCRPKEVELTNVHDFYANYEVVKQGKRNKDGLYQLVDAKFRHPSYVESKGVYLQGVRERAQRHLVKVFQFDFPDTAEFGGDILDPCTPITEAMETYAELALILFQPFRSLEDLQENGTFTEKFRTAITNGIIGSFAQNFLQNIQDAKANCLRSKLKDDDLQRVTDRFMPADEEFDTEQQNDDENEFDVTMEGADLDEMLNLLNQNCNGQKTGPSTTGLPASHDLTELRNKGTHAGGHEHIAAMNTNNDPTDTAFEVAMNNSTSNTDGTDMQ